MTTLPKSRALLRMLRNLSIMATLGGAQFAETADSNAWQMPARTTTVAKHDYSSPNDAPEHDYPTNLAGMSSTLAVSGASGALNWVPWAQS